MNLAPHALAVAIRLPARSLAAGLGVAIAAGLLTSVILFGTAAGTTASRRAIAAQPIDAQVVVTTASSSGASGGSSSPDALRITDAIVRADPAVRTVLPFALVHFTTAKLDKAGTATQTGTGVVVGIDSSYTTATGLFATSAGAEAPGQIRISRDLATNLGAVPGDQITFDLPGGASVTLTVAGIVDITGADLLLGPIDPAHRAAGANPPVNVAVVDAATLQTQLVAKVPPAAVATDPATAGGTSGGASSAPSAPGAGSPFGTAEPAVRQELHLRYDRTLLPGDPVAASGWLDQVRRRIERQGAGAFVVIDDAAAALAPVANDVAWGQVLFIFLALPGVLLALALSELAGEATADTTRRHAALLRARGATVREIVTVFLVSATVISLVGSMLGAAIGAAIAVALFGQDLAAAEGISGVAGAVLVAVGAGLVLAVGATALVLRGQLRDELALGRRELETSRPPLWRRLYLDIVAIAVGIGVYLFTGGTGVHPVLNAEGNPTVTLALTAFLAPLLVWSGGTLLLLRLVSSVASRSSGSAGVLRRLLGPGGELAARSLAARPRSATRTIVLLALAMSFAVSVLVFDATFAQQQRVDAALTLGGDLKAVPTMPTAIADALRAVSGPGIASVTPFVDRVVYVGSEAQDLLAIDPMTLPATSTLSDTFFHDQTAAQAMADLAQHPDTILVSAETAKDYSLVKGDRVRIRVPDANGVLKTVDFHMGGVVDEFPTAPKDAFLVANLGFVASSTTNDRISFVLARARGDVGQASKALAASIGPTWHVDDISTTTARLANTVTAVDLGHLVQIDVGFAVVIASIGVALFLLAGIAERRRELATLRAIGAEPAHLRSLLLGETSIVAAVGVSVGLVVGLGIGGMLLQVLAGIFDPPAQIPAVPIAGVAIAVLAIVVGLGVALVIALRAVARLAVLTELRER